MSCSFLSLVLFSLSFLSFLHSSKFTPLNHYTTYTTCTYRWVFFFFFLLGTYYSLLPYSRWLRGTGLWVQSTSNKSIIKYGYGSGRSHPGFAVIAPRANRRAEGPGTVVFHTLLETKDSAGEEDDEDHDHDHGHGHGDRRCLHSPGHASGQARSLPIYGNGVPRTRGRTERRDILHGSLIISPQQKWFEWDEMDESLGWVDGN